MRNRQKRVATDTWRSLGCRTTPLEHWSRRKPTVEPGWAKQQTKKLRPKPTKINSFMSGPSLSLTPDPPVDKTMAGHSTTYFETDILFEISDILYIDKISDMRYNKLLDSYPLQTVLIQIRSTGELWSVFSLFSNLSASFGHNHSNRVVT